MSSQAASILGFFDEFEKAEKDSQQSSLEFFEESPEINLAIDGYCDEVRKELIRRLKVFNYVEKRLRGGWTEKNLEPILSSVESDLELPAPKWRTLVCWKKIYLESGRDPYSLIPKHLLKGNREKVIDSQVIVDEAITKVYLTRERLSVAEAYRYYTARVVQLNRFIIEGKIKPVSERTFYNRIKDLPPYEVDVARFGKRYADRQYRAVGQQIIATKPMEYVEIDHTPVPVILIDDELDIPLGRPYLTMLYDRFSKCIVGLSVNFREPSFDSVRKALLNSLLDKSWIRQKYPMIKNDWPCHGKIDCLVVDNGAEFWSKSLEDSLRPLVSDIQYSQAAKPWRKSGIEKLFDQLNKGLNNAFPGKTFTNPTQLHDYDPKKDAVVRVSVFLELLHIWVVDFYHMKSDSRERAIPYHKWQQSQWVPSHYDGEEAEKLKVELGLLRHRSIGIAGIRLHNLRYQSNELIEYRKYHSTKSNEKLFVRTKTDPSDISHIHVYLEPQKKYIKVPAVDNSGYTKGLSLFEHERIQKVLRLNTRELANEEALADTFMYMKNRIQGETDRLSASKKKKPRLPKTSNTSKLAKFQDVGSDGPNSITTKINEGPVVMDCLDDTQLIDDDFENVEGY
ncbi:Mu transposase C-terminal domain-containing protein [Vibrio tetraodonis]|uniref:Mu transposase C-terminal domain-containing protein n=1 Tax=Vibrio tetraodonis TaxID=2231647 RepID=UPI000E0AB8A1|nr:Mu transposase C-terminal domain-containing protein [Vibrio tetraodonis]